MPSLQPPVQHVHVHVEEMRDRLSAMQRPRPAGIFRSALHRRQAGQSVRRFRGARLQSGRLLGLRRILQRVTRPGQGGSEDAMPGPEAVPPFDELIARSPVPVLVEFWAEWCGACRSLAPALGRIASEYKGVLVTVRVNIDRKPHLASRYQVSSIPTVMLFRQNRILLRFSGAVPFEEFKTRVDGALRNP